MLRIRRAPTTAMPISMPKYAAKPNITQMLAIRYSSLGGDGGPVKG